MKLGYPAIPTLSPRRRIRMAKGFSQCVRVPRSARPAETARTLRLDAFDQHFVTIEVRNTTHAEKGHEHPSDALKPPQAALQAP